MDKKNQDDSSVGDDFNLSHENQLPPIWDNISEELNALDGDSVSMDEQAIDGEELLDVASFSVIKEGFQSNFDAKEPPKFIWDKIEQDLESLTTTDAPSDFSAIKTGFEQNYKKAPIPNFTWADLAEEMDNPKPKEKVEDYGFVKRGFEKEYSAVVVPLFSWADLAQRMDNEAIFSDTPDNYSIVKESFQKEYATHKPAANTWAALDQQLESQSHWKKALVLLFAPTFLKKTVLFMAIGLLIFGGKFYLSEDATSFDMADTSILASHQGDEKEFVLENLELFSFKNAVSRSSRTEKEEIQTKDQTQKLEKNREERNQEEINAALMFLKKEDSRGGTKVNKTSKKKSISKNSSTPSEEVSDKKESLKNKSIDSESIDKVDNNNSSNSYNNNLYSSLIEENADQSSVNSLLALNEKIAKEKEATIRKQALLDQKEILRSNLKLLANDSSPSWIGADVMDVEILDDGLSVLVQKFVLDEEIPKMEEENFTLVRQMQKGKKIRFEIGLVGRSGTSVLLGKNTYDAWNGDDATTTMCPSGAFGVLANYHFSHKDAVVLAVYPYSTVEQCFGGYNSNGSYENTRLSLALFDFTLGYQRTLIQYTSLCEAPSKVYARLDLGLGILTNAKTSVNEGLANTTDLYNKFNVSAGLALGNTHEIKQFVIDYGLTGNIGLNRIVTAANPAILAPARLLNVGAYIGMRYIISPRLEPSKKQRQFDWSPPFYIEEPVF
jgi:hypothetical protein